MASHLALIQRVQGDDELQRWNLGRDLQQSWNMRQRADHTSQLAMVDDELGGLRAKCLIQSDRIQRLRNTRQLCVDVSAAPLKMDPSGAKARGQPKERTDL